MATENTQPLVLERILQGDKQQLKLLQQAHFPGPESQAVALCSSEQLAALFTRVDSGQQRPLTELASSQLEPTESIAPGDFATLVYIDKLFSVFFKNSGLHSALIAQLKPLRVLAARLFLQQTQLLLEDNLLQQCLLLIQQHCQGWHPQLGKAGSSFINALQTILERLINANDDEQRQSSHKELEQFFNKKTQRTDKLEARLRDAEEGVLRASHAQQLSARELNQKMAGKKLPAPICEFLQNDWRDSLSLILVTHGEDSEQWREARLLTEAFIWGLQPHQLSEELQQRLYSEIPQQEEDLRRLAISLSHDSDRQGQQFSAIESQHLKILQGEPLNYDPFTLIENTNPLSSAKVSVSSNLSKQVETLNT